MTSQALGPAPGSTTTLSHAPCQRGTAGRALQGICTAGPAGWLLSQARWAPRVFFNPPCQAWDHAAWRDPGICPSTFSPACHHQSWLTRHKKGPRRVSSSAVTNLQYFPAQPSGNDLQIATESCKERHLNVVIIRR